MSRLEAALDRSKEATDTWRTRLTGTGDDAWLAAVPDVGPACEVVLADQLFHDLTSEERDGLLTWIRETQDPSGAWLDAGGAPNLSITALAWWALVVGGEDPGSEPLLRAARVVHALGGAQRAELNVRLWLAMAGQIPWTWLPAVPTELWLLPAFASLSPTRIAPWARGMLTPYLLLSRAPARLHLADAAPLLLRRGDGSPIPPRLTRPGLAGDVLQAFDRTVKLSRKLPRGPVVRAAVDRVEHMMMTDQQEHGGWFSCRPTVLSLLALRVIGATSNDARIDRGLAYLRSARGRVDLGDGRMAVAQGLTGSPLSIQARLLACDGDDETSVRWVLRQELDEPGPWQWRADTPAGGWPAEAGARSHLDVRATCDVLDALAVVPGESTSAAPAWGTVRRAIEVLLAMQEPDGSFSRFERGESNVFMRRFPWRDADLLAFGDAAAEERVETTAAVTAQLGRTGIRDDDDRVRRTLRWLSGRCHNALPTFSLTTLAALGRAVAQVSGPDDELRRSVDQALRSRQREDGSFGTTVETAQALTSMLELGGVCVQSRRAARSVAASLEGDPTSLPGSSVAGLGLSPGCTDVSATPREARLALSAFVAAGGTLGEGRP